MRAPSPCSGQCGCSEWRSNASIARFAGPAPRSGVARYGAFLLQGPVLIGLALAVRSVPFPADVKALLVAVGGVAGSFALARFLVERVPGAAHIL